MNNDMTGKQKFVLGLIAIFVFAGMWWYSIQQQNARAAAQRMSQSFRSLKL